MKHRGENPVYGPNIVPRFAQSSSRPLHTNTRSDCYYCNRFGKLARKCGHNDAFLSKKSAANRFNAQCIRNENIVQRTNLNRAVIPSAPPIPSFPVPGLPPTPPPAYQESIEVTLPPPPQYEERLPEATVIVHQPTVTATAYHRHPVGITCPFCHNSGITRVRLESGCLPWLLCGILCFFGFFFGCCLIPFCLDSTKSARHFCPSCNRQVGYYSPL